LTKEEIEWLEENPNRQAYTLVCIEKQANDVADNKIQTNCDVCGKEISGIENFINAGDKVVCFEECLYEAIGQFRHWENTPSDSWREKKK
ncbi:MAG: hypothetical protein J6W96_01075, partial [Alphaproteobacteria bacterium]|nr:hypothetical protein [Alphaproteobacteria bacterium]